ncbi:MAG: efflux RND transporter periplasmic adaptor subunit [Halioglobus sp.]|nr:efflux RND transporter periplasmic adaptor subunit [Halioglobus sp.]
MLGKVFVGLLLMMLVVASAAFIYSKAVPTKPDLNIVTPERATIRKTIVANGNILPREEIRVKPQISGVIKRVFVRTGDQVKVGDILAEVEPQPSPAAVNEANSSLREAEIRLDHARRELRRAEKILPTGAITDTEYRELQLNAEIAVANLQVAERLVEIVRTGASVELGHSHSEVRSTIAGTILERPVDIGSFVIETNPFNQGTTIVKLADMNDLLFVGEVDEESAGQLRVGMPVLITIGAFPEQPLSAAIETIAPQSSQRRESSEQSSMADLGNGAVTTFEIHAKLDDETPMPLRAGYSATAEVELSRAVDVLAIRERDLHFRDGAPYVMLAAQESEVSEQPVRLGLSDGIRVEVLEGVSEESRIATSVRRF